MCPLLGSFTFPGSRKFQHQPLFSVSDTSVNQGFPRHGAQKVVSKPNERSMGTKCPDIPGES